MLTYFSSAGIVGAPGEPGVEGYKGEKGKYMQERNLPQSTTR